MLCYEMVNIDFKIIFNIMITALSCNLHLALGKASW